MKPFRTGDPDQTEWWGIEEIMDYLNCDKMKAKQIFEDYHRVHGGGYGEVEKHLMLDFINQRQREEREREARYQADLADVEQKTILKEQVKVLQKQVDALNEMSASSSRAAHISNIIAVGALIVALISLLLK